jgi:hypothetical protein
LQSEIISGTHIPITKGNEMTSLTPEQQRQAAIRACDRIEQLNAELQMRFENIARIFENVAAGRDPKDGLRDKP